MNVWDRALLRGLRSHLPDDAEVVALERGRADALGEMRKTTAVLTDEWLLLATSARVQTVLTKIPRRDIRSVKVVDAHVAEIRYDDYAKARAHLVRLDLRKYGDRADIIAKVTP